MLKLLKHLKPYSALGGRINTYFYKPLPSCICDVNGRYADVGVVSGDTDYIIRVGLMPLVI